MELAGRAAVSSEPYPQTLPDDALSMIRNPITTMGEIVKHVT
ncbi:hypothetical protein [Mycobacterium uberis]|nr:hypothetical protein [Mycobacterium uberis]